MPKIQIIYNAVCVIHKGKVLEECLALKYKQTQQHTSSEGKQFLGNALPESQVAQSI
jgi:hypothetical protein